MENEESTEELQHCHEMGFSAGYEGANLTNCDYRLFSTKEKSDAWLRGNTEGLKKKLDEHRAEAFITCPGDCWCWLVEHELMRTEQAVMKIAVMTPTEWAYQCPYCNEVQGWSDYGTTGEDLQEPVTCVKCRKDFIVRKPLRGDD